MTKNTQRDPSTNTGSNDRDQKKSQQGSGSNQQQNQQTQNKNNLYQQGGASDHHGLSSADTRSSES